MDGIAQFGLVALDTSDPVGLAEFYSKLTGWPVAYADPDWVQLDSPIGVTIACQLAPDHRPPTWPGNDHPQQLHIDFEVFDDLDRAERQVLDSGARKAIFQPKPERWRVFLDPAGHPFCFVFHG